MIPVKVRCECGQKYAFEVEPVGGRMGSPIACPVCGVDGTAAANLVISQFMVLESDREQGLRISAWKPTTPASAQPLQNLSSAPPAKHRAAGKVRSKPFAPMIGGTMVLLLALGGAVYVGCSRAPKKEAASKLGTVNDGFPKSLTELNEWYVEPPAGQNAADFFSQGFDRLQIGNAASSNLPLLGKGNPPPLGAALPASVKSTVSAFVRSHRDALQLFAQGRQYDQSHYPVNLALGFDAVFPHLAKARSAEKLLVLSAIIHADANEGKLAADDVLSALALANSLSAEPMLLSQSIRAACVAIAVSALEQSLNRVSLPKDSLTELLKLLQKMEDGDARGEGFSRGLAGERATWIATLQAPPKLLASLSSPGVEIPADQRDSVVARLQKGDKSKDEQKSFEKTFHELMAARHETFPARLKADSLVRQRVSEAKGKKLAVLGVLLSGFAGSTAKEAETLAQLRLAGTAVVLEHFRAANDNHFPAALSELVPDYLPAPLADPFDGHPLRYRKQANGYLLYSIGPDLKDDGGERTNGKEGDLVIEINAPANRAN